MAIIIREDSKEVTNKLVEIPKGMVEKAKRVYKTIGEKYPTAKGSKRIKKIATSDKDETYNKKKGEGDVVHDNGKVFMKGSAIKKADHELRHMSDNPNNLDLAANGGYDFKKFYSDELKRLRTAVKQPEIVKQVKPNNVQVKPESTKSTKPSKLEKQGIHVHEGKKIVRFNEVQLKTLQNLI